MSEEINEIFVKYKNVFLGRKKEIKDLLLKYYKDIFKEQIVEKVERIDETERIKKAGFKKNISTWRNTYRNIILSSCEVIKGKQKRYDYKFYFVEEKLNEETIELIENAMKESDRLVMQFKFDEARVKIEEMIELIRLEEDKVFNKRLFEKRKEISATKEKYEKGMEKIADLEEQLKLSKENGDFETTAIICQKIINISESIKKIDIKRKYSKILEEVTKKIEGLKGISRLEKNISLNRTNERYETALRNCEKIIELANSLKLTELSDRYSQIKEEIIKEIQVAKEKYGNALKNMEELEIRIDKNLESGNFKDVLTDCEKIIEISRSVKKYETTRKYRKVLEDVKKKIKAIENLEELEKKFEIHQKKGNIQEATRICIRIIRIASSLNREDLVKKYSELREKLKKDFSANKQLQEQLSKEMKELEKKFKQNREKGSLLMAMNNCERIIEIADAFSKDELIVKYSKLYEQVKTELEEKEAAKLLVLEERDKLIEKAKEIEEIIEVDEDVLPLVEEFSIDEILGDLSEDASESLEQIESILNEHRVEIKNTITNKVLLTSASGDISELEKIIDVQKSEDDDRANYIIQSGLINPFDDVIEEAIITDLIPYNFEIVDVELNGQSVKELPDKSLTADGIEVNWQIKNIQPKEKVEINYNLRRRVSRSIIFLLEDQLKIVKTHSNIHARDLEGLFEAKMPFTNTYEIIKGVIIEDIIPLYYIHFIEEPKLLPHDTTSADQGELVKWNVGEMKTGTRNYHYKLLELYKFEELKILINQLSKEGINALKKIELQESMKKFLEIKSHLDQFITS